MASQIPCTDRVRVVRDSRDSSRDYWLDRKRALELYVTGVLAWSYDTNSYVNSDGDDQEHE